MSAAGQIAARCSTYIAQDVKNLSACCVTRVKCTFEDSSVITYSLFCNHT